MKKNRLHSVVLNGFCFVGWLVVAILYRMDWNDSQIMFSIEIIAVLLRILPILYGLRFAKSLLRYFS